MMPTHPDSARRARVAAGRDGRRGQSTVEYVLLVAVLVVGLLVAAYAFVPGFSDGVAGLGRDVEGLFGAAGTTGSGEMR